MALVILVAVNIGWLCGTIFVKWMAMQKNRIVGNHDLGDAVKMWDVSYIFTLN
jgi:hypothetical protein